MTDATTAQNARILWQIAFDRQISTAPLALSSGVALTLARGREHELICLSHDGESRWSAPLPAPPVGPPIRSGELLAVPLEGGRVVGLHLGSGRRHAPEWAPLGAPLHPRLAALGGHLYARIGEGDAALLVALSAHSAAPLWRRRDPSGGGAIALMRRTAGVLVFAGEDDAAGVILRGLDPHTGATRWSHHESDCELNDLWAIGGIVDLVTTTLVRGFDARDGGLRNSRFTSFPLEDACAKGEHLVTMMEGHTGPVLLCFDSVSQRLRGRITRAMTSLVGAHPNEVMVTLDSGLPALYALPTLEAIELPEASALGTPLYVSWAGDRCYLVPDHRGSISVIGLDLPPRAD